MVLPFIIFSLPRSRSAWLSALLRIHTDGPVGHDLGLGCQAPEDFVRFLTGGYAGTCETGAAFAWPLIRKLFADRGIVPRVVVIRRNPDDVTDSLARAGYGDGHAEEMHLRDQHLAAISEADAVILPHASLSTYATASAIVHHCTGQALNPLDWDHFEGLNVQLDRQTRIDRLIEAAPRVAQLKADIHERLAALG